MKQMRMRTTDLRQILIEHQRAMLAGLQGRIREGRIDVPVGARDPADESDAHAQGDIEISLLQMQTETLSRIGEALARVDAGTYGFCSDCEGEISERRLRALPFALRCQECETRREQLHLRMRKRGGEAPGLTGLGSAAS